MVKRTVTADDWKGLVKQGFRYKHNQATVDFLREYLPHVFGTEKGVYGKGGKGIKVGGYVDDASNLPHHTGRSADIYLEAAQGLDLALGNALFDMFISHWASDLGIEYVIWNKKVWVQKKDSAGVPRPYYVSQSQRPKMHGDWEHKKHIHVTFTNEGATKGGTSLWMALLEQVHEQVFHKLSVDL